MRDRDSFNRIISLAALVATLFLMLFSSFYITEHANHHFNYFSFQSFQTTLVSQRVRLNN